MARASKHAATANGNDARIKTDATDTHHMASLDSEHREPPALFHKVKNERSILALAVSEARLFAGTQSGEILVWSLEAYERLRWIKAHERSVLSLHVSEAQGLLFSSAGDAIVNVWCTKNLDRLYSIYSTYDVGDVFCVAYSASHDTVYLGAQNTSIQWYNLSEKDNRPTLDLTRHPIVRNHRFFDSKGPGGTPTPRLAPIAGPSSGDGQYLEIDKEDIVQYAHNGYTYCMLMVGGCEGETLEDETLISGGGDGTIKIWSLDATTGAISELKALESGDASVLTLVLDDTLLYTGRLDGEINIWDLETYQLLRRIEAHTTDVLTLCVGHGSLFSGSADGVVKQFTSRYECMHEWQAHNQLILASILTEHRGKRILVTGGNDDCIAIWDVGETGNEAQKSTMTDNDELYNSLSQLVAFRTVSSKPEYAQDCRRGASWLKSLLKHFGADTDMFSTSGSSNPVVFARFQRSITQSKPAKTILFYGHYDVVPADNKQQLWESDPFVMVGTNGYLYGRGVSDNKGPILAAIYAVAELVSERRLSSDVVFLIEGEEECGSRGFAETVRRNKDKIGVIDWILLANSYWLDDDIPCLTYGLRGVVHATVEVTSHRANLHSGVDGSQRINEAMKDLISILAVLSDNRGLIKIPRFYDSVLPLTREEDRSYTAISTALISRDPERGDVRQLAEQLKGRWREPSLTVHRITSSGPTASSVIPHTATATLSVRLVPRQTTSAIQEALKEVLSAAFAKLCTTNELTISIDHTAEPWLGVKTNKIFQALEEAVVDVWGHVGHQRRGSVPAASPKVKSSTKTTPGTSASLTNGSDHHSQATADSPTSPTSPHEFRSLTGQSWKPLFIREGGSIPAIRFLEQEFEAPAAHLPCGQASDKAHLDNERLRLSNLYKSKEIFKRVFRDLPLR
ncbi:MAG: hypothetical protein Q9169_005291 [Polycauliona sp. 2 TL-2023]